jgi:hypothetical protein
MNSTHHVDGVWIASIFFVAHIVRQNRHDGVIPIRPGQRAPIRFTFRWLGAERWEGQAYLVVIEHE